MTLSPIGIARSLYDGKAGSFDEDLKWHLRYGLVHSDWRTFLMARPVRWGDRYMLNPTVPPPGDSDTWFVWMAAGKGCLSRLIELAPYPLPYVGYHRHKSNQEAPKRYSWDRLNTLIHGHH